MSPLFYCLKNRRLDQTGIDITWVACEDGGKQQVKMKFSAMGVLD
jgi:hypothetical protein